MKKLFLFSLLIVATTLFAETKVESFTPKSGAGTAKTYESAPTSVECEQATWTVCYGGIYKNLGKMGSDNWAGVIRAPKTGESGESFLQSSTIEGGIKSLSFTWNGNGGESGTWNIEIYINDSLVHTFAEAAGAQLTSNFPVYTIDDLDITGDFTIKFVNKCDYSGTDNKFRFVIDNLTWETNPVAGEKTTPTAEFAEEALIKKVDAASFVNALTTTSDATPVYTSSEATVATVAADGTVTIVGVGTTTITATLAETATFKATEATYTLRVVPTNFNMETFDGATNATGGDTYLTTPTASFAPSTATGITWTTYLGSVRDNLAGNSTVVAAVIRGRKPAEVTAEKEHAYLVSDAIKGGIASLAFDWNCNGDESSRQNPWDIEVYVNDVKVGAITDKCTAIQPMGSWYRFTAENINVAGDFTIKVVNKNDADSDGNQYRFVLDNLEWLGYEAPVTLHKVLVGEDLQAVVNGAVSGDTVLVQAGTYEGNFTMKDGVYVSGGWNADFTAQTEHASILDAKQSGRVLNQPAAFTTLTIWDNFTIQNGKLTEALADKLGAGVALLKNGRVINCLVQNNTFTYDPATQCAGGGIAQNSNGDTCAINCIVRNNKATHGGGIRTAGVAINCLVENNEATGNGGGVYLHNIGQLHNSIVRNNVCKKDVGGVDIAALGGAVYNCLVVGNSADGSIGGVQARKGNTVVNTTIVGNNHNTTTADRVSWAGYRGSSKTEADYAGTMFVNNVIWGNTHNNQPVADQIHSYLKYYAQFSTFANNALQGATDLGADYIALSAENDPQFNEDYSFASTSPLYNAGSNNALTYFVGDKDVYGNARKQGENIEIGAVEIAEPTQTIITETFDLTTEDTRNMMGTYNVYAGDYILRIYGYMGAGTYQDDPATEDMVDVQLFTPDYDEPLAAVVVVTIDEENNKEVMQVTATSADGKKIYNLTFNIVAPEIQEHVLYITYPTITVEESPMGGVMYIIEEAQAMMDTEDNIVTVGMTILPSMNYAEMSIGDNIYATGEALVSEPFMGEFTIEATLTDDAGNTYYVTVLAQEIKQDIEIVVADTVELNGYNMTFEMQGNMAIVTANVQGIELFFWMTMYSDDNGYGTYFNDAITNVWYGENSLTPYGDEHVYSAENLKVSFINDPDEEGNVTLYNFTLYAGEKPAEPTKHTVNILISSEGAGTVTGAGEYEDGAEVTVTATANKGWIFYGWLDEDGECLSNDDKYTFTAIEDVNLVAYFFPMLEGTSTDCVISGNKLTATAQLSVGLLKMNLVLGEEEEEDVFVLTEESTLTINEEEAFLEEGRFMAYSEALAIAAFIAVYKEVPHYITVMILNPTTGVDNINTTVAPVKMIENGQLIIMKGDAKYNVQGAQL